MRERIRIVTSVTLISLVTGAVLGFSAGLIRKAEAAAESGRQAAVYGQVLPGASTFTKGAADGHEIYEGRDAGGNLVGLAFSGEAEGFGGPIKFLAGVDPRTQAITGVVVVSHSETPGLGSLITEAGFLGQFPGKALGDRFEAGADIQAVSGATISSQALASGVKAAAEAILAGYETGRVSP